MKIVVAALVLMLGVPAFAGIEANGGFETIGGGVTFNGSNFATVNSGLPDTTSLPGWTISGNGIDIIGWNGTNLWVPNSGTYSIDLNAGGNGIISQTLTTTVGQAYQLSFYLAGNANAGPAIKTLDVVTGPTTTTGISFDTTSTSNSSMGWVQIVINWTATSTSSTLSFTGTSGGAAGPALDDISVTAVPEPGTFALFGIGIGLGAFGLWRRAAKNPRPVEAKAVVATVRA